MLNVTFHFVLLVLVGLVLHPALSTDNEPVERSPPQPNPNNEQTRFRVETKSLDPLPNADDPHDAGTSLDDTCNANDFVKTDGETLVNLVKGASPRCVASILRLKNDTIKEVCNEPKMKLIAEAFNQAASNYDPSNPSKVPEIKSYTIYLRVCHYASFHRNGHKCSEEVESKVRSGIDTFLKLPNLDAQNDDHYRVMHNVIHLISNTHNYLHFVEQLSQVLAKVSDVWKFQSQHKYHKIDQSDVVNAIFYVFFRSHTKVNESTTYYCKHPEVTQVLNDFMNKHADLVNTTNEYILRNAGGELARFLKYKCIQDQVDGFIQKQLKQYTATSANKVWMTMVVLANHYGSKKYGGKNMRINTDMEKRIMTYTKNCGKTYMDTFIIRAQNTMTDSEANELCQKLKNHESYFHNLVKDSWQPVGEDLNDKLEVVIFNDEKDYKYYGNLIYSIDTNNGGYYLEGHPDYKLNVPRYYCYKMMMNGKKIIWNFEHEFTHYLDGRYNMKYSTLETMGGRRIWWLEGFPEYAAYNQNHPNKVKLCKAAPSRGYTLSYIFYTTYSSGVALVYDYSYLAARFMFEKHRSDVDTILRYFRAGQYSQFENWFNGIYNRYDQEFNTWCSCIASGQCQ